MQRGQGWQVKGPLVLAVGLGLAAGGLAWGAIQKERRDLRKGWSLVPVLVAATDVAEGSEIIPELVAVRQVPEAYVTSSVVRPDAFEDLRKQRVLVPLKAGDPFLWTHFEATRSAERLSAKIQKRTRAVTINASKVVSVGGWVRPNDHVDVIGTFRDAQSGEQVAVTVLQNVVVLATGRISGTTSGSGSEGPGDYSNVSLVLLPEEVEILTLAAEMGSITLALRNEDDLDVLVDRGRATARSLLQGERMHELERRRDAMTRGRSLQRAQEPPPVVIAPTSSFLER